MTGPAKGQHGLLRLHLILAEEGRAFLRKKNAPLAPYHADASYERMVECRWSCAILPAMERRLTDRQRILADLSLTGMEHKLAAIKAGYAPAYADDQASAVLRLPQVIAYMDKRRAEFAAQAPITVQEIVSRLNAEATNPTTKLSDRIRANQLLGEHLGMFGGKIDATAWIREQAIKEGMDPDEAVREDQAILDSQKGR